MAGRKIFKYGELSADQIANMIYRYSRARGTDQFAVREFLRDNRVSEFQLYTMFESWGDAREAAGLSRRRTPRKKYSDDEMLAEYHRVVMHLRRTPRVVEIERHSSISIQSLRRRFGGHFELLRAYGKWLDAREKPEDGKPFNHHNPTQPRDGDGRDVRWMQKQWCALRVGFELRTSDFRAKGYTPDICDLLVVLENDEAPPMPLKVIELQQVVWV